MKRKGRSSPYRHLWPELAYMPALSHWPDRMVPFSRERSEVLAYIAGGYRCALDEAERIFQSAKHQRVIRYNPNSRRWRGVKGGEP